MDYHDYITFQPGKRSGQPCIRDTRMTVWNVLEYLAGGMSMDELLAEWPDLTVEDIRACFAYAVAVGRGDEGSGRIGPDSPADDELIRTYIEQDPNGRGLDGAILKGSGVPVWTLIGYSPVVDDDPARVAHDYDIPSVEMDAALAFNRRHGDLIAARLLLNNAAFA